MEVIMEGTNSPKLTLSGSPPLPPPTPFTPPPLYSPVFASGSLSQLFLPSAVSECHAPPVLHPLCFQEHITHLKKVSFSKSRPVTRVSPSPGCLPLRRSIRPLRHITLGLCASGGSPGFQTLSPTSAP